MGDEVSGDELRHHQALAGGASTSPLQNRFPVLPGHHQALAGGSSTSQLTLGGRCVEFRNGGATDSVELRCLAKKLKYHRLKRGGVRAGDGSVSSYEIEVPPAKARWCPCW